MAAGPLLVMIIMTQAAAATLGCSSFFSHEFSAHDMCGMEKQGFYTELDYNRNMPPPNNTNVSLSLFINRVSGVDENKEEISLDVFLQVYWEDDRITANASGRSFVELPWSQRHCIWMPDLYIRQLREMRVLSVFHEMTSVRLYLNHTIRVSIGATIIIKCDMDFVLYPLDVQNCAVDFSSYKYTAQEVTFDWRGNSPVSFPSDFGEEFRLPRYVVSFSTDVERHLIYYGEGNHSTARLLITMSREIRSYLLESYLPSSLFVVMSWGSFCVMPEIVPGRMVLLVTTLLSLVTMFDTVSNNSPDALELKCIEVWLISCTLFVFLALLEYFLVLFGIRYDKAWRRRRPPIQPPLPPATNNLHGNHVQPALVSGVVVTEVARGGVFAQARIAATPPALTPSAALAPPADEPHDAMKQQLAAQCIQRDSPVPESSSVEDEIDTRGCARVKTTVSRAILFCGSQRGTLDKFALMLFPLSFIIFTTVYWTIYLNAAHRQMEK